MTKDEAYRRAEEEIDYVMQSGSKVLHLPFRDLTELPESLRQCVHLQALNLSNTNLVDLPEWLGQLTRLQSLDLSNIGMGRLPKVLVRFERLQSLNLSRNRLEDVLLEGLMQLTQLQSLDLSSIGIISLPNVLSRFTQLQFLDISDNGLTELPDWFGQLVQLRDLVLYSNHLTHLPLCIVKLPQLINLSLANNPIEFLPNQIGELCHLQSITLGNTEVQTLPEGFGKLEELKFLSLGHTPLACLPEWIGNLKSLRELDLSNDKTLALHWADKERVWVTGVEPNPRCNYCKLPDSLRQLTLLSGLYLHGNDKLDLPVEILGTSWATSRDVKTNNPADILDYYFRTRRGRRPLNEAKIILVGRGGVGKTSLIKRLIHGVFDEHEAETPGIEIQPWEVVLSDGDRVRLHVWDFGGQEILHATHQFFLTERTVYLLVLSGREGAATHDAEYWLQLIRSFGGGSPVIVALNKSQEHPFDVNRGLLLEKYSQIAAFIQTDCECSADGSIAPAGDSAMGVEELRQKILKVTADLEHRKVDFPADWFAIKERLAGMRENFVTWDEYQDICRSLGEQEAKAQRDLAGFLHILGIALNYRNDPRLHDTHVLNPRWVTEGIYSILRNGQEKKQERKGVLEAADLASALDPEAYPSSRHEFLLALMEKFQLCFPLPRTKKHFLVPELLGENQPDEIKSLLSRPGLAFRYEYEVLPEGLLPRFIVQTHAHSASNPRLRWRTGVVLNREGCCAVVRADARERRVEIHISGPEQQRRELLAIIREHFDVQHDDLKGLTVQQRIPVPGEPGVTIGYHFLLMLEAKSKEWCWPEGAQREYRVADLLNGIESRSERKKVFEELIRAGTVQFRFEAGSNPHFGQEFMEEKNALNIGDNATINAPVGVNQTFANCFNTIKQIKDENARQVLDALVREVEVIYSQIGEGAAKTKIERQTKLLTEEAAQPEPDKGQIQLSGKNLIDAATTCAGMAGPVIEATKAVLQFFGVSIP